MLVPWGEQRLRSQTGRTEELMGTLSFTHNDQSPSFSNVASFLGLANKIQIGFSTSVG